MNEVNSFTFYKDYYNLIDTLPLQDKTVLAIAILDYVFKDIEPKLSGHNQAIFNTLKNQLNVSKCNSKRRTGRKPKKNQKETGRKPKDEPNENKTSILSFKFLISNFKFDDNLEIKIEEWLKYKSERKEYYKETGFKSLLVRIQRATSQYGVEKVINLIDECMANNYKGIIFEKLEKNLCKGSQMKIDNEREKWLNE